MNAIQPWASVAVTLLSGVVAFALVFGSLRQQVKALRDHGAMLQAATKETSAAAQDLRMALGVLTERVGRLDADIRQLRLDTKEKLDQLRADTRSIEERLRALELAIASDNNSEENES